MITVFAVIFPLVRSMFRSNGIGAAFIYLMVNECFRMMLAISTLIVSIVLWRHPELKARLNETMTSYERERVQMKEMQRRAIAVSFRM